MKISLLICTGNRPEAFRLCQRWMNQQIRIPDEVIVVDDGWPMETPTFKTERFVGLHPLPRWEAGGPITQCRNICEGFKYCTGDVVCFIEDDDYYAPGYLAEIERVMEEGPILAGYASRRYYHLTDRTYRTTSNCFFTSLAQTCITREGCERYLIPLAQRHRGFQLDVKLWRCFTMGRTPLRRMSNLYYENEPQVVSIKGLPGRPGATPTHYSAEARAKWSQDFGLSVFKYWIGSDWMHYGNYLGGSHATHEEGI